MTFIEILVIILVVVFFALLIGRYVYKKKHHIPTGECECCMHKNKILKEYHKKYPKA